MLIISTAGTSSEAAGAASVCVAEPDPVVSLGCSASVAATVVTAADGAASLVGSDAEESARAPASDPEELPQAEASSTATDTAHAAVRVCPLQSAEVRAVPLTCAPVIGQYNYADETSDFVGDSTTTLG